MVRAYVHICTAKKCYNSKLTHPNKGFFTFPSDVSLCKIWLKNCGRADLSVNHVRSNKDFYRLCSDHFEDSYFTDNIKTTLNKCLCPLPTIFTNNIPRSLPSEPQSSSSNDIDLAIYDAPTSLSESFLDPSELHVEAENLPVSYHSSDVYGPERISEVLVNLKPETELYEIRDLCRLCMNKVVYNYVEIFSDTVEASEVRQMCEIVMPKKIVGLDVCDGLPHRICRPCITDLKTCRRLIEKFQNADSYLREIAKYSLFVENKDNRSTASEDEYNSMETDFLNSFPKSAMVVPLDDFNSVLEESEFDLGETNNTEYDMGNTSDETRIAVDSVNQLLQSLRLSQSTEGQNSSQHKIELVCRNVVILPSEEDEDKQLGKRSSEFSEDNQCLSQMDKISLDISKKTNKGEINKLESRKMKTSFDHFDREILNEISHMINDVNVDSEENTLINISYKCVDCYEMYTSYSDLTKHVMSNHLKVNKVLCHLCTICSEEFRSSYLLSQHRKMEHSDVKIQCPNCEPNEEGFKNRRELSRHIKEKHRYKCSVCQVVFDTEDKLSRHTFKKHTIKTDCKTCGKQLKNINSRKIHEMSHDPSNTSEVCWVCGAILKTRAIFNQHMKIHDRKNTTFTCDICNKTMTTRIGLKIHRNAHLLYSDRKPFLCQYCPKTFLYKVTLSQHLNTHLTEKPYNCQHCRRGFNRKRNLVLHEKRRNAQNGVCPIPVVRQPNRDNTTQKEKESLKCDICERVFLYRMNLRRHRKFHFCNGNTNIIQKLLTEPEKHKCEICNKVLCSKMALLKHTRLHTGSAKPFKCEFCGNSYSTHYQMIVHLRVHTGEKPYKCRICNMRFRERMVFKSHEVEHSEDKPHVCQICQKAFKMRRNLLTHTFIHKDANKSIRPFRCTLCDRGFVTSKNLMVHTKNAHGENSKPKEDNYPCSTCERVFMTKIGRQRHIRKMHPVKQEVKEETVGEQVNEFEYIEIEGDQEPDDGVEYLVVTSDGQDLTEYGLQGLTYIITPAAEYTMNTSGP